MSVNYYLVNKDFKQTIHIGKSSMGWKFLFNVGYRQTETPLDTFDKWMEYLAIAVRSGWVIMDEYDREENLIDLRKHIIEKQQTGMDYWHPMARSMLPAFMDKSATGDSGERYCPKGFRFSTAEYFF